MRITQVFSQKRGRFEIKLSERVVHVFKQSNHIIAGGSDSSVVMVLQPDYHSHLLAVLGRPAEALDGALPDYLTRLPGFQAAGKEAEAGLRPLPVPVRSCRPDGADRGGADLQVGPGSGAPQDDPRGGFQ